MNTSSLPESFGTLSETINGLIQIGYTHDFNIKEECIVCRQNNTVLPSTDFQIDKVYRFEGESNPEDQAVLYAISSSVHDMKGTLVNGYGISDDEDISHLIEKLHMTTDAKNKITSSNAATEQRPDGARVLDATFVELDLNKSIAQLQQESNWKDSDRNSITLFKSDTMRIVLLGLHEHAELKTHKANGVISVQVIQGIINFTTLQQTMVMEKGQIITLSPQVLHSVLAVTESFILLTVAMNQN